MRCRVVCKENYTLNILRMHPIQLSSVQNQWLNSPSILVEYDHFQNFLVFPWQVGISPGCTLKLALKGHCETSAVQTEKPARSSTGAGSRWWRLGEQGDRLPAGSEGWQTLLGAPWEAAVQGSLSLAPTRPWAQQQLELLICRALKYQQQGKHYYLASWEDWSQTSDCWNI